MLRTTVLILAAITFTHCGTPRRTGTGGSTADSRFSTGSQPTVKTGPEDSIRITGTEYVPVYGRNEAGVRVDLEGSWVLHAIGTSVALRQENRVADLKAAKDEAGKAYNGTVISNRMNNATEVKRDSVSTKTSDGTVYTTTTVYLIDKDGNTATKITPPQGQTLHIPAPPSLSFYGSNETFSGFTGCNKISGRFSVQGNKINFQHSGPSTRMVCIGDYDEQAFLSTLKRVNSFRTQNGQLELLEGDNALLVFTRK
jgi:heat shock protein HslJ